MRDVDAHRPTGDFQRMPTPTPVRHTGESSNALPLSTKTAAPHGPLK